ncbi:MULTISPECIES: diaminopimelate dehydrogenase [Sporomusa]|uniref:diaminopimelate dehydrogenase n=1 Tax=Sporomusa TaxID=2375 RepID=UPI002030330A|nr:diaminopimelate dehydrogenase [Sporomusa sphaeroides]MCM0759022.1 diaminopimelate dehydrogenase [Sporomusa sphaeroides DSM 2875]
MSQKIRIGIVGYGNLGKGAELAVRQNTDMELVAVFSRRRLEKTLSGVPALLVDEAEAYRDKIDVMLLCGGSATDLIEQGPRFSSLFNTVDSFDTHAKIPAYYAAMEQSAKASGKAAAISVGWDPGLFSLNRLLAGAVLPQGTDYTFWGKGVSQGHSDAVRRIPGVKTAKQYTVPKQEAISGVRSGTLPPVNAHEVHVRDCYVVAEPGADLAAIETAIKTMPHYFSDYETHVSFVSEQEFEASHAGTPHGGFVFRTGQTSPDVNHVMEFALKLDSNPEFTASVLVAYARAVFRLAQHGGRGAYTVFDIPFGWLSPKSAAELRQELL